MKIVIIQSMIFCIIILFCLSCRNEVTSPSNTNSELYIFRGRIKADGVYLPDTVLAKSTITLTRGSDIHLVSTDSVGVFLFSNLFKGQYIVRIEKSLPFGNMVSLDTTIIIPMTDSSITFVLRKIKYDYFPLNVGNKWQWVGAGWGALLGNGGSSWGDTFNVMIQIIDKKQVNDTSCYHFYGYKTYISGTYRSSYYSTDTIDLAGIKEPVEGYFKEKNGMINTEFISDGSIASIPMFNYDRKALVGAFHSFLDASAVNRIFPNYDALELEDDSLKLKVLQYSQEHTFLPNVGLQFFSILYLGNNPIGTQYYLSEYTISK